MKNSGVGNVKNESPKPYLVDLTDAELKIVKTVLDQVSLSSGNAKGYKLTPVEVKPSAEDKKDAGKTQTGNSKAGKKSPTVLVQEEETKPLELNIEKSTEEIRRETEEETFARIKARKPKLEDVQLVDTETTTKNMEKLGICLQTGKNALMVGPTGVGKTAMAYYLAALTHNPVHYINLKDSTDISEIIGGYRPDPKTGKPVWADGIVTEAAKYGGILILDEFNLAQPGVLVALNPLLDYRREITLDDHYGEIIKAGTFKPSDSKDPNAPAPLFIIATMNPSSYSGRQELSADMKNRFHIIYVDPLKPEEMVEIIQKKSSFDDQTLLKMIMFHSKITYSSEHKDIGRKGGPYTFTLRDLKRWAQRIEKFKREGKDVNETILEEAKEIYINKFMDETDRLTVTDLFRISFGLKKGNAKKEKDKNTKTDEADKSKTAEILYSDKDREIELKDSGDKIKIGELSVNKDKGGNFTPGPKAELVQTKSTKRNLLSIAKALDNDEFILLVGETASGKTSLAQYYARLTNKNAVCINLQEESDTSSLIGGYKPEVRQDGSVGYKWVDGKITKAVRDGWLVIMDEANAAFPEIIEGLNHLHDKKELILTEHIVDGGPEVVKAAPGFGIIATMNPPTAKYSGKNEMSPAFRNRFTERWVEEIKNRTELEQISETWLKEVVKEGPAYIERVKQNIKDIDKNLQDTIQSLGGEDNDTVKKLKESKKEEEDNLPNAIRIFEGNNLVKAVVDFQLKVRKEADDREIGKIKHEGYLFTLRNLKNFCDYVSTFISDSKNAKLFIDAAMFAYADEMSEVEDKDDKNEVKNIAELIYDGKKPEDDKVKKDDKKS